jgi:hypothetical protein
MRLYHPDISTMAEHSINLGHSIQFQGTYILAMITRCIEHIIMEVTEIEPYPCIMNREESFSLSKAWKLFLQTLKKQRKAPPSPSGPTYTTLHIAPCTHHTSSCTDCKLAPHRALSVVFLSVPAWTAESVWCSN